MAAIRLVEASPGRFQVSPALAQMPSSSADTPDIRLEEVFPGTFRVSPALAQMPGTWLSSNEDGTDNKGEDFDVHLVSGCADSYLRQINRVWGKPKNVYILASMEQYYEHKRKKMKYSKKPGGEDTQPGDEQPGGEDTKPGDQQPGEHDTQQGCRSLVSRPSDEQPGDEPPGVPGDEQPGEPGGEQPGEPDERAGSGTDPS